MSAVPKGRRGATAGRASRGKNERRNKGGGGGRGARRKKDRYRGERVRDFGD